GGGRRTATTTPSSTSATLYGTTTRRRERTATTLAAATRTTKTSMAPTVVEPLTPPSRCKKTARFAQSPPRRRGIGATPRRDRRDGDWTTGYGSAPDVVDAGDQFRERGYDHRICPSLLGRFLTLTAATA